MGKFMAKQLTAEPERKVSHPTQLMLLRFILEQIPKYCLFHAVIQLSYSVVIQ